MDELLPDALLPAELLPDELPCALLLPLVLLPEALLLPDELLPDELFLGLSERSDVISHSYIKKNNKILYIVLLIPDLICCICLTFSVICGAFAEFILSFRPHCHLSVLS